MTIAEAGPVGRIKHNFSVMVRAASAFQLLIISSASRPLSPFSFVFPSFCARAHVSLYLSVSRFRYTLALLGIHFHAFSWATLPSRILSSPPVLLASPQSRATLRFHRLLPTRQLSSDLSLLLSLSLCLASFFHLSHSLIFSSFSRALITNFLLFARNSRAQTSSFFAPTVVSFPHLVYFSSLLFHLSISAFLVSLPRAASSRFIFCPNSPPRTIHIQRAQDSLSDTTCRLPSAKRFRETQIYTAACRKRRIGKSCNAPAFHPSRLPVASPSACLFVSSVRFSRLCRASKCDLLTSPRCNVSAQIHRAIYM